MSKCGDPMVSINDIELFTTNDCDDRRGNAPISRDEICTCPKPILSIREVCSFCVRASRAKLDDGVKRELAAGRYFDFSKVDVD